MFSNQEPWITCKKCTVIILSLINATHKNNYGQLHYVRKHVPEFILCLWENVASVAYLEGRLKSRSCGTETCPTSSGIMNIVIVRVSQLWYFFCDLLL